MFLLRIDSPLFTFLSGFYQKNSADTHIFYQLSFDDVRRIAEYAKSSDALSFSEIDWKVLPYTGNPEEHGIIYWIGCLNEAHQYMNPITQVVVACSCDSRTRWRSSPVETTT